MGTVTVSTTPVQLDDGSHATISIGNTGAPGSPTVTVTIGSRTERFEPGFSRRLSTGGVEVTAVTASGTTTLAVDTTGVSPTPGQIDEDELADALADLALGDAALLDVGTSAGTVAAGNDSRIIGAAQRAANLSDVASAGAARTNIGAEAAGAAAAVAATLGTSATRNVGTTAGTVTAGDDSRVTGALQGASNLSDVANAGTARSNLGAAPAASPTFTGTVTIPAAAADTSAARYGQLPTYTDGTTKATTVGRSRDVDVRDRGAVADGSTNNGPALLSALNSAKAGRTTMPFSLSSDAVGNVSIYLPAGDYVVTDIGGLLGQEAMSAKGRGLRIYGDGAEVTRVIFKPTSAGDLMQNDYWINLQVEGIGFYAATADCTFMHSSTTHNAQRYRFVNCYFKDWKYGFYLEGNNNNSEMSWINCHNDAMQDDGAFLRIPSSGSDQFLNYWFYGCTHWSTDAPFIYADKGGHFKIYGLDASDWGASLSSAGYLFRLAGATHALGVCTFIGDGIRVEAKNANAALISSAWPQGNVTFSGTDWSSQTATYTYGDIIKISYSNVDGAQYTFKDCNLAGGVNVAFASGDWGHSHRILFEDCQWRQKTSPSDVVTYDVSSAGINTLTKPPVEFLRCRGTTAVDITSGGGAAVWDATIGYAGETLQTLRPRCVSARDVYGTPNSQVLTVVLPVGALITGFEALSPAGAVGEGDGGAWALATTEGSPTTIATATVTGAMSSGYDVNTVLAVPYLCDSSAKAKVTITPSSVSQNNSKALLLIKGYW